MKIAMMRHACLLVPMCVCEHAATVQHAVCLQSASTKVTHSMAAPLDPFSPQEIPSSQPSPLEAAPWFSQHDKGGNTDKCLMPLEPQDAEQDPKDTMLTQFDMSHFM
jgi:hypothetical protein